MSTKRKLKPVFHVTLSSVGTPDFSAGYGRMEHENAVKLIENVMFILAENMVGAKNKLLLVYTTCIDVIKNITKPDADVNADIKEHSNKSVAPWVLVENKPEEKVDG